MRENNCAAAHLFMIYEKQVQEWKKNKLSLKAMPKTTKASRSGIASFPEMEKELNEQVLKCRENRLVITKHLQVLKISKNECSKKQNLHNL